MKKIKLKEAELVNLIEKLVKENLGAGNGQNFGIMGTPTAKYKEMFEKDPCEVIHKAVWGMLPHNRLGRRMIVKLKVYKSNEHPHDAQNPVVVDVENK